MILVELTPAEIRACIRMGEARYNESRSAGRRPQIDRGAFSIEDANVLGELGETAFAKVAGLALKTAPTPDDGWDFSIPRFGSIDVKTARSSRSAAAFRVSDDRIASIIWDYGVSAAVEDFDAAPGKVWLVGWIDRHSFCQESARVERRFGTGHYYTLGATRLGKIEPFIARVIARDPPYADGPPIIRPVLRGTDRRTLEYIAARERKPYAKEELARRARQAAD